jgi:multidrug efflux pump subunit AcrA (membrane-fusion protein)
MSLLAVAVVGGCSKPPQQVELTRPVRAVAVSVTNDEQEVTYTGDVRARWKQRRFRGPRKIVARLVEVGRQVKKARPWPLILRTSG